MGNLFWWVIFPYITLVIMIVGVLYRYAFRQLTWAAPSTEFFEKRWLKIGSPLFHYGIIFAFGGHVMGIVIPKSFYALIGLPNEMYHIGAIIGGGIAGLMVVAGLIILLIRKMTIDPIRIHATFADFYTVIALLIVAGLGAYMTIIYNTTIVEYEYRDTIGPWFRSLFTFNPKYELMATVPLVFKIHIICAFGLFASIPFTGLIHFYSVPIKYPLRAPQQYRSRSSFKRKHI
jgi:nitrate reductase gamma subunit